MQQFGLGRIGLALLDTAYESRVFKLMSPTRNIQRKFARTADTFNFSSVICNDHRRIGVPANPFGVPWQNDRFARRRCGVVHHEWFGVYSIYREPGRIGEPLDWTNGLTAETEVVVVRAVYARIEEEVPSVARVAPIRN